MSILQKSYKKVFLTIAILGSVTIHSQINCGSVNFVPNTTVDAFMTFDSFSKYQSGITLISVARLRVKVEDQIPANPNCSWKLRMFIENNSGAGTPITEWEEVTLYGNGNSNNPLLKNLEVRVRNNCNTPVNNNFVSFNDTSDIIDIIEEMLPQVIINAGSCTKNVNSSGSYLSNYDEFNFDIDLRYKPGFKVNPGIFKLNIRFRLEEVN